MTKAEKIAKLQALAAGLSALADVYQRGCLVAHLLKDEVLDTIVEDLEALHMASCQIAEARNPTKEETN